MKEKLKKNIVKKTLPNESDKMSRRDFLSLSAMGLASLTILPSWKIDGVKVAPSDRVVLGFVGLGQQGCSDFSSFSSCPGVQVAACCDVDSIKRERFRRRVTAWQKSKNMAERCDTYEFYEEMLERTDIDAIEIATPDHWHALIAIDSCDAGKHVYCQKPSPKGLPCRLQPMPTVLCSKWEASNAQVRNSKRLSVSYRSAPSDTLTKFMFA